MTTTRKPYEKEITDNLDALLDALPPAISEPLSLQEDRSELLEVVLDLGRPPLARFPRREMALQEKEVSERDIEYAVSRIGRFGDDNRAGIERTLHRISAIRNRRGRIVGLTLRVGRAVYGTIRIIQDLVESGKSILLLGRPGVGKTTMLREVARVLADDIKKRVVIVDTSNEIAGDGDIPHPAIGRARRMQVPTPSLQHDVMIEAVENHMPEVIVIDEIGTELEARAARTIAERGVQLIGTAHGNTLNNLMQNPTLSDLIGGIQSVTLGDEEARRRGTQKSILERKAPPTFEVVVEIQDRDRVAVHDDVAEVVDAYLRGSPSTPEVRWFDDSGGVRRQQHSSATAAVTAATPTAAPSYPLPSSGQGRKFRILPFGISRARLEMAARELALSVTMVAGLEEADFVVTARPFYRRKPQLLRDAEARGVPIYVLRSNSLPQMKQCLTALSSAGGKGHDSTFSALREAEEAIDGVLGGEKERELSPQSAYVRRLQHQLAERHDLDSRSLGKEPQRRVLIFRGSEETATPQL